MKNFAKRAAKWTKPSSARKSWVTRCQKGLRVGAMIETPSIHYAPKAFFDSVDFLSIGGNDLKQFFFAADRENELVRKRYDTLSSSFLSFLEDIVTKCQAHKTPLSFCGEDAGRPLEAVCLAALGLHTLSMRPASIGPRQTGPHEYRLESIEGGTRPGPLGRCR